MDTLYKRNGGVFVPTEYTLEKVKNLEWTLKKLKGCESCQHFDGEHCTITDPCIEYSSWTLSESLF